MLRRYKRHKHCCIASRSDAALVALLSLYGCIQPGACHSVVNVAAATSTAKATDRSNACQHLQLERSGVDRSLSNPCHLLSVMLQGEEGMRHGTTVSIAAFACDANGTRQQHAEGDTLDFSYPSHVNCSASGRGQGNHGNGAASNPRLHFERRTRNKPLEFDFNIVFNSVVIVSNMIFFLASILRRSEVIGLSPSHAHTEKTKREGEEHKRRAAKRATARHAQTQRIIIHIKTHIYMYIYI